MLSRKGWLADKIDILSGDVGANGPNVPLTIEDLKEVQSGREADIELATMTADLTSQRPHSLPLKMPNQYFFDPKEMRALLPDRVVAYMIRETEADKQFGPNGAMYPVPVGDKFPFVLAARMSLSFPIFAGGSCMGRHRSAAFSWRVGCP
ncbi:hypothetical protein TRL7639_00435 [Falsiruegeria litorea R37]|uniref:Uncharacterized protein n=1 Tax=Falsiruegeria litorea R37 TaxID=1200284 RepID=A0A1Y5RK61_9RHOB|nr:hypothetical protein TRL7639_00435 [Falsiruegeria litorea R37]